MIRIIPLLILLTLLIPIVSALEITSEGGEKANVEIDIISNNPILQFFRNLFKTEEQLTLPPFLEAGQKIKTLLEFSGKPTNTPASIKIIVNKNGDYRNIQDYTIPFSPPSCFEREGCFVAINFEFTAPTEQGKYTILANVLDSGGRYVGIRDSDSFTIAIIESDPEVCEQQNFCEVDFRDTENGVIKEVICHEFTTEFGCQDKTISAIDVECDSGFDRIGNQCIQIQEISIPEIIAIIFKPSCTEECIGDKIKLCLDDGTEQINDCGAIGSTCVKSLKGIGCQEKKSDDICRDTDGDNIFKKGFTYIGDFQDINHDSCLKDGIESSADGDSVRERICENNNQIFKDIKCPTGVCGNFGECIKEEDLLFRNPERCEPLIINGDSRNKIDVVFIATTTLPLIDLSLEQFKDDAKGLIQKEGGILTQEPFKSNKNLFNWWFANTIIDNKYKQYDILSFATNPTIESLVDIKKDANSICGFNEQIIFLGRTLTSFTDFSWTNNDIVYIDLDGKFNEEERLALTHEFGHSFGKLGDEYLVKDLDILSAIANPNCDLPDIVFTDSSSELVCKEFKDITDVCIAGCGTEAAHRSSDNSVMRSHFEDVPEAKKYNEVSKIAIQKELNKYKTGTILQSTIQDAISNIENPIKNVVYFLELNFNNGVTQKDIKLIEGQPPDFKSQPEDGYTLQILNNENNKLFSIKFGIPDSIQCLAKQEWFDGKGNQIIIGTCDKIITKIEKILVLPYFNSAEEIKILDPNDRLQLTIDVSNLKIPEEERKEFDLLILFYILGGIIIISLLIFIGFKILKK